MSGTWVARHKAAMEIGFMIHIMVYNMPKTIDLLIARGGKIIQQPDMDAQEVRWKFSDPAGNILWLYQQPV